MGLHLIEATLLLLFLTTIAVPWAQRTGLPMEILLVVGSLALSVFPGLPPLALDPDTVFLTLPSTDSFRSGIFHVLEGLQTKSTANLPSRLRTCPFYCRAGGRCGAGPGTRCAVACGIPARSHCLADRCVRGYSNYPEARSAEAIGNGYRG